MALAGRAITFVQRCGGSAPSTPAREPPRARDGDDTLLDALSVSPSEYAAVYSAYREALQTNADPEKTAIFQAARLDAARGGREHAIARLNGFLDALNSQGKGTSENLCNWTEVGDPTLGAAAWIRQHPR